MQVNNRENAQNKILLSPISQIFLGFKKNVKFRCWPFTISQIFFILAISKEKKCEIVTRNIKTIFLFFRMMHKIVGSNMIGAQVDDVFGVDCIPNESGTKISEGIHDDDSSTVIFVVKQS